MTGVYDRLQDCFEQIRARTDFVPETALVLGSGLGNFADRIRVEETISYSDIKNFPVSTVPGHAGKFIFGYVGDKPVVCMKGRVHYYEGYGISDVVLPVRLMGLLGARILFLTNAAGGINPGFEAGDLMLITDHIGCFVPNPLIGANEERLGVRFPDMSSAYDGRLAETVRRAAAGQGLALKEGVYAQLSGPSFETPAEIRMLGLLGADAVGMSTAVEAIAAVHMGLRVCGVSCISNMAAGIGGAPLCHEEVQQAADRSAPAFARLVTESIHNF